MDNLLRALLANSYAPYSGLHFACIIEGKDGKQYGGVNVENASYGGTICAERNAINNAISQGVRHFKNLYLMTDAPHLMMPCSICKQSFLEFFKEEVRFVLMNTSGAIRHYTYEEILKTTFTKEDMVSYLPTRTQRKDGVRREGERTHDTH